MNKMGVWLELLWRDARYAGRMLRRSPGFAAAVILTLGLGIGANSAIFSIVDRVLLRSLPYPNGDQLVMVYESHLGRAIAIPSRPQTGWIGNSKAAAFNRSRPGERASSRGE